MSTMTGYYNGTFLTQTCNVRLRSEKKAAQFIMLKLKSPVLLLETSGTTNKAALSYVKYVTEYVWCNVIM